MLNRWHNKEKIPAIHKRDLESILTDLKIIDQIKSGKYTCANCDAVINLNNIQCLFMENNQIKICCDNLTCYRQVMAKKRNEKD